MDINKIKNLHFNSMKKIRKILPKTVRIIYEDNSKYIVPCTISDISVDLLKYNEYTGKDYRIFNILIEDLRKLDAPIKGFTFIEYNLLKYQVQNKIDDGIFNNTIKLVCVLYRGNVNE